MADKNVRYLNPISIDTQKEKYCRFQKKGIKYIDYKDADFILMLRNCYQYAKYTTDSGIFYLDA